MSTTTNFVTKRILFIAEVRDYGGNTPGYTSTSTEPYITDLKKAAFGMTLTLAVLLSFFTGWIIYESKEIFLTTL